MHSCCAFEVLYRGSWLAHGSSLIEAGLHMTNGNCKFLSVLGEGQVKKIQRRNLIRRHAPEKGNLSLISFSFIGRSVRTNEELYLCFKLQSNIFLLLILGGETLEMVVRISSLKGSLISPPC